ncbi:MAG: gamma-glutamyltransferase family protein [Rhodospirillales bacterium]|jgi:gamma-glutamyltranspeptidase/glutathione hydrolase
MSGETAIDTDAAGGMRNAHAPTPSVYPPPESMRPTLVGRDFMVSAGHPVVAQIMCAVLEAGGTAIDAGVAGGIASNVVQVDMCNLGGIAPILIKRAGDKTVWSISGVGPWGREATLERFRARYGDDIPLGSGACVVPAALDAWVTALQRFGTRSFADMAAPAIGYAAEGLPLDHRTATALGIMGRSFSAWDSSREIYWWRGRAPRVGEVLRQPDLARTLQGLAAAERGAATREDGLGQVRAAFYEGEYAERLVAFNRRTGGWLSRADLAEYRSEVVPAPSVAFRGWDVHATGLWTQGPVMLQALGILEGVDLEAMGAGSADALHWVIEALKLGFLDRERFGCDPRFAPVPVEALLDPAYLARLRGAVRADQALMSIPDAVRPARPRFDTTYVCAIDRAGNAFSAMPSDTLDGSPIIPGLGYAASCRGVQSRLDPAHVNVLAPGKRPRITPAPALAVRPDGDETVVFGCPGGDVIVQSMAQAFVNLVAHRMLPQQAVEAPRVCTFSFPGSFFPNPEFPGRVDIEARVPAAVRDELSRRGHKLSMWPDYEFDAGAVSLAGRIDLGGEDGPVLAGAADPRRTAYAAGR